MMRTFLVVLSTVVSFALPGYCATFSVPIGTQATIVGYTWDQPSGLAFFGIPYAQPPVGQNRFAPPQRKDPAGAVYAFHYGSACVQGGNGNFGEDCLFLNIFTPRVANITQSKYPVFFWIHGGGFVGGSGDLGVEGALSNLVNRGMIVVSINYRLGPFGFYSTRDSTIPGNMALLDMIEALNWVKRYISYFGGDPDQITVAGESSGAEGVSLLTLSPLSRGMFKQAVIESGSGFVPAVMSYSEATRDTSKTISINMGCTTASNWDQHNSNLMSSTLNCMRSKSVADIQAADNAVPDHRMKWGPVLDSQVLPDRLETLALSRPPMPVLIGNCHDEYLGWYIGGVIGDPNFLNMFTRQWSVQDLASRYELRYYNNTAMVHQAIEEAYIDSLNLMDTDHVGWCKEDAQMYTEMIFVGPTYRDAMTFRQTHSPVYLYSFDYLAPGAFPTLQAPLRGVPHAWELQYLFGYPATGSGGWQKTPDDDATMNYFGQYWANFVITGNPTPSPSAIVWPLLGSNGEYMSLGPVPTPSTAFHPKAASFWACTVPALEGYKPNWCT
uniref:Carboxylic ester hydrolase n=1 Tax=Plectus sambesii TaxID=2011161 RepID=A0A914V394_9BILA